MERLQKTYGTSSQIVLLYILLSFYFSNNSVSIFVKKICDPLNFKNIHNLITSSDNCSGLSDKYGILYSFYFYFSNQMKE